MPLSHSQILEGFECSDTSEIVFKNHCQKRKMDMDLCGERNFHEFSESGDCKCEPKVSFPKRKCLWSTNSSQHHIENFKYETLPGCLKDSSLTSSLSSSPCQSSESSSSVPLPRNMGSNNLALHFLSCIQHKEQENATSLNNNDVKVISEQADWSCDDELMDEGKELMQTVDYNNRIDGCNNNHLMDIQLTGLQRLRSSVEHNGSMDTMCSSMDSDFVPDTTQYASCYIPVSAPQNIDYGENERTCAFLSCSGLKPSPVSGRLHCHCSASWRGMYGIDNGYVTDYY